MADIPRNDEAFNNKEFRNSQLEQAERVPHPTADTRTLPRDSANQKQRDFQARAYRKSELQQATEVGQQMNAEKIH